MSPLDCPGIIVDMESMVSIPWMRQMRRMRDEEDEG
jgi:hypothetical protein